MLFCSFLFPTVKGTNNRSPESRFFGPLWGLIIGPLWGPFVGPLLAQERERDRRVRRRQC